MKTYPRKPLTEISEDAEKLYGMLCDEMDEMGFIGFEASLKVSVESIKKFGDMKEIGECMNELQDASMVFAIIERAGWIVRFPIVRF